MTREEVLELALEYWRKQHELYKSSSNILDFIAGFEKAVELLGSKSEN